ncbi:MAG TPA: ABC transporter permease [Patescibacteria group bacterium]|nr:ABC transporter permease [Patescibacteria group bacterium]
MAAAASPAKIPGVATTAYLALAFLYIPILIVIIFSFNANSLITVWKGFTTDWYLKAFQNDDLRRATINSLVVAVSATVLSTLIALMAAIGMRGKVPRAVGQSSSFLMTLPLLIPEIVIAIATMSFFFIIGLDLGLGNVLIAHTVFCIPFAYSPIRARIETLQPSLFEAAADLYATPWQSFRRVTLPLMLPGITSGAMLAFITSLDDFIITQMVAPPGAMTLPVYIYSMVRKGITPEINAVSSILLVISIILVVSSYVINQRKAV